MYDCYGSRDPDEVRWDQEMRKRTLFCGNDCGPTPAGVEAAAVEEAVSTGVNSLGSGHCNIRNTMKLTEMKQH